MNQDHPIVTAGVIAKAVEDTLGRDACTSADGQRKKYIIALTDGANGRSSATVDEICQSLMGSSEVTPFIIGAGGDIPQHDVSVMQRMVGQVPYIPAIGGMYVAAEKTEDLEHAFETVAAAMAD